jgi:hypothetical protein
LANVQDFDEDAPVWKKTWNRLTKPQNKEAKPKSSALQLIEQSNEVSFFFFLFEFFKLVNTKRGKRPNQSLQKSNCLQKKSPKVLETEKQRPHLGLTLKSGLKRFILFLSVVFCRITKIFGKRLHLGQIRFGMQFNQSRSNQN